ncbi:MAG: hypothetical protein WD733_06325 [Bryobacterales bacterium]
MKKNNIAQNHKEANSQQDWRTMEGRSAAVGGQQDNDSENTAFAATALVTQSLFGELVGQMAAPPPDSNSNLQRAHSGSPRRRMEAG